LTFATKGAILVNEFVGHLITGVLPKICGQSTERETAMKKLVRWFVVLSVVWSFSGVTFGQDADSITVKKSDLNKLSPGIVQKVEEINKTADITIKLEEYSKWAGMGKEIGVAVNEGLKAVTTQTAEFAKTTPGKVTMAIIVWKVMGKDFVGAIVGIPFLIIVICVFIWILRRTFFTRRILVKKTGKDREYRTENDGDWSSDKIWGFFGLFVVMIICCAIIVGTMIL